MRIELYLRDVVKNKIGAELYSELLISIAILKKIKNIKLEEYEMLGGGTKSLELLKKQEYVSIENAKYLIYNEKLLIEKSDEHYIKNYDVVDLF